MVKKLLDDGDVDKELKNGSGKAILIDFYADWCGPCRFIAPTFEEYSKTYSSVIFLKVDVDKCEDTCQKYKIQAMPTFVLIGKDGKEVKRIQGASKDKLKELAEQGNKL